MQQKTASSQNPIEELRTLIAATRLHLLSYPLSLVQGSATTKEFFQKPIKQKSIPKASSQVARSMVASSQVPSTVVSPPRKAPPQEQATRREPKPQLAPEPTKEVEKKEAAIKNLQASNTATTNAALVKNVEVVNPYLRLAARPFLHHSPLVFEDIAAKAPKFPKRKVALEESVAPMPWIKSHPKAIIIASCPDCFIPFIQSVTKAIDTKLCPVALYIAPQDDDWAEIVTQASTGKTKAIITFVDRKEQEPYSSVKSFIEEVALPTVEPFGGYGTLFGAQLLEVVVDHDLVESKPRKGLLWNALGSLYA